MSAASSRRKPPPAAISGSVVREGRPSWCFEPSAFEICAATMLSSSAIASSTICCVTSVGFLPKNAAPSARLPRVSEATTTTMLGSPRSEIITIWRQIDSPRSIASPGTNVTSHIVRVTFETSAASV